MVCAGRLIDRFDLITVAAHLLFFTATYILPFAPKRFGDLDFHIEAQRLVFALKGVGAWGDVVVSKAPAPVAYYAIAYLFVPATASEGAFWLAGLVWNFVCLTAAVLMMRRVAAHLGGEKAGRMAVGLYFLLPYCIYYSFGILAEVPAAVGLVVFFYGWTRWQQSERNRVIGVAWIVSLAGLLLFTLSRPNGGLLLGMIALYAFYSMRSVESRQDARFLLTLLSCSVTLFLVTLMLVPLLPGRPLGRRQIENLAFSMVIGRFQYRTEPFNWEYWAKATREGTPDYTACDLKFEELARESQATGVPVHRLQFAWVIRDTLSHPLLTARMALTKLLTLHLFFVNSTKKNAFRLGSLSAGLVYWLFHIAVNLLNLSVILIALKQVCSSKAEVVRLWYLWTPWLALVGYQVFTYCEPRYMFPAWPGIMIICSQSIGTEKRYL